MHEEKYYKIRRALFWGLILIVVILTVAVWGEKRFFEEQREKTILQEASYKRVEVAFDGEQSQSADSKLCYLCGENDRSLVSYYRQFGTVGIISLNDWYVVPFQLEEYANQEKECKSDTSSQMQMGNTGEIIYSSNGTPSRGMAEIKITLPEEYRTDVKFLQKNLCQECLEKVTDSLKFWRYENEEKQAIPLCLIDFNTLDVYSMQDWYQAYFVRDYWVELDFNENEVNAEVFYLPERKEEHNE